MYTSMANMVERGELEMTPNQTSWTMWCHWVINGRSPAEMFPLIRQINWRPHGHHFEAMTHQTSVTMLSMSLFDIYTLFNCIFHKDYRHYIWILPYCMC